LDRFDRRVVFLRPIHTGGAPIIVIRDELAAPQPATYQFLLHALNRMEVDPAQQRVTIAQGASRCRVDYLAPQGLRFDQHDQFTHPPFQPSPNQWHLTASTVDPAPTAGSLIVLQPFREGEADQLLAAQMETPAGYAGVRLTGADRMILVMFLIDADAPPPAPPYEGGEQGGVVTDAQAFSLRFINPPQWKVRSAVLFEGTRLQLGAALLQSDVPAALSGSLYGASWRLVSSDAPHGAHLAADFGQRDTWTHGDGPAVAVFEEVAEGVAANPGGLPAPTVQVPGSEPVPFEVTHHEWVQRLVARASVPGPRGHYEAALTLGNAGTGSLPVVVAAGSASLRQTLAPGQKETKVVLPAANLGGGQELTVTADEAIGGQLLLSQAAVQRAYGVNLLPNGSFEEVADGVPVGWRATTITQNAQAALASAEGGRNGGKCLKITCTEATGGDFGAILNWPGITLSEEDRRFRMACWVKTDATSVAGLQVTSADWTWWKNTERLKDRPDWAEAALEFILPAGQNLTHVRLHANAAKSGAELFVDDVSLVEVPRP
jgi:hypothetical protein